MTDFQKVYDYFFSSITDDLYVNLSKEETQEDILFFLKKAILRFRYPKKDLSYDEKNKTFKEKLNEEECYLLALYMVLEWINRQIATVRITEMQYTGSDLKNLGTKNQMVTLEKAYEHFQKESEKQLNYYQMHSTDKIGLAGKKRKNGSTRSFKETRKI